MFSGSECSISEKILYRIVKYWGCKCKKKKKNLLEFCSELIRMKKWLPFEKVAKFIS